MHRRGRKNGIPDRWLDYKAVGKRLGGTRFVAFKVPLKQSLNQGLAPAQAFGPWELLDAVREDRQELGLVIDLTFTRRYYGPQDLPTSLCCIKIPTEGHVIPADGAVLAFKRAVRRFLRDNAWNDELIGVHCTHGLNRTGYMICRYLIDVDGMNPSEAIKLFNSSRGHDMERSNYIDDLCTGPRRSNVGMDERPPQLVRGKAVNRTRGGSGAGEDRPWGSASHTCRFFPPGGKSRHPLECPQYDRAQHYRPTRSALLPFPPAHSPAIPHGRPLPRSANRRGWPARDPVCPPPPHPPTTLPRHYRWDN